MNNRTYFWRRLIKDGAWKDHKISKVFSRKQGLLRTYQVYKINKKYACWINKDVKFEQGVFIKHKATGVAIAGGVVFKGKAIIHNNVVVGRNRTKGIKNGTIFEGNVIIGSGAYISADNNITIGSNVFIGANAVVTKNVPSNSVVIGINVVASHKKHIMKQKMKMINEIDFFKNLK